MRRPGPARRGAKASPTGGILDVVTGTDVSYEHPYGIRPVTRAAGPDDASSVQVARARKAAAEASVKVGERFAELRAVTAKAPARTRHAA
jgi:hypothetical protein